MAQALSEQADGIREKLEALSESLREIEALKAEVLQMQTVDFKKYADIIVNLRMKNESYWLIKHFDDRVLEHCHRRFDRESGLKMLDTFQRLQEEGMRLLESGVLPESGEGQAFAKAYWDMVQEFTGGDMSLLPKLMETERVDSPDGEWRQKQAVLHGFIEPALDVYLTGLGCDPFGGGDAK